jgi:hypothetical protein
MSNSQASKIMSLVTLPMLILFGLKLLCIWYFTSRVYFNAHGAILGYPYDTLAFNTFDRFTDWLMPVEQAMLVNPYDLAALHAINTATSAYGYLSFVLLKMANVFGPIVIFLLSIAGYLYLNYLILRTRFSRSHLICLNAYTALLIACYPLYYEIDRGNIVIWEALLLSWVFLEFTRKTNSWSYTCALAVMACLKPSFLLFMAPILAVAGFPQVITAFAITAVNYAIPMFLPGGGPAYLTNAIQSASAVIGLSSTFCHNVSCALRVIGISPITSLIVALFSLPMLYVAYLIRRSSNPWEHAPLLVIVTALTSLLIADPSSDYALIVMLPIFLYLLGHEMLDFERAPLWRYSAPYLIIGFILAMSFINMPFPGVPRLAAPLRCLGLLAWYIATIRYLFRTSRAACRKSGAFTLRADALASREPMDGREAAV